MDNDICDNHASTFKGRKHPDGGRKHGETLQDHARGAGHPKHHSRGKMQAQLQPDHGPHKGAGRNM